MISIIRWIILLASVCCSLGYTCNSQSVPCFPFMAGPILLYVNSDMWYNQYVDFPGYCDENFFDVALSLSTILWQVNSNTLNYTLVATQLSSAGFSIYSNFNQLGSIKTIQISFLAYREKLGIQLQRSSSYFSVSNSVMGAKNTTQRKYALTYDSTFQDSTNYTDFVVSVNYRCMDVQFTTDKYLNLSNQVQISLNKVIVTLASSKDTVLNNICLDVLVFKGTKLDTVMASYNYTYGVANDYVSTTSLQTAYQSTYMLSNFNSFTGATSNYVTLDFQFGYTIASNAMLGPWFQQTPGYNLSIVASSSNSLSQFTYFVFSRNYCTNPSFPYANSYNDNCCDQCPPGKGAFGFKCVLCSEAYTNCQECNSNACIKCSPLMAPKLGVCASCSATQLYSSSNYSCTSCATAFPNCSSCNQTRCLQCSPNHFYDTGSQSCLSCNANKPHCVECTFSACTKCESSYYLDSATSMCTSCNEVTADCNQCTTGTCAQCPQGSYLNTQSLTCDFCSTTFQFCLQCNSTSCLSCDNTQQAYLQQQICEQCSPESHLDIPSQLCHICTQYNDQCTSCTSQSCTGCQAPYVLLDGTCISSEPEVTFQMQVCPSLDSKSVLFAFLYLNKNLGLVSQTYSISFSLDGHASNFSQQNYLDNNTIVCTITYFDSLNSPNVSVKFTNSTPFKVLKKTEDYKVIDSIYVIRDIETTIVEYLSNITEAFSSNSGSIMSSLSLTSTGGYLINALWSVQIISLYNFVNVTKPKILNLFLNSTLQLQNIQLLPFPIPDPFENYNPKLIVGKVYSDSAIEPCFIKSNFRNIVSVLFISLLYLILFAVMRMIQSENCVFRFFRRIYVFKLYSNLSASFYNILIPLGFSSAVTITSRGIPTWDIVLNNFAGHLGLLSAFAIPVLLILLMSVVKDQQCQDLQGCFLVYKPKRRHSELILLVYLLSQIAIPVMIPLFHPMHTISFLILMRLFNIALMLGAPVVRIRGYVYIRVLQEIAYILFNLVFVVLYILQQYIPNTSTDIMTGVGKSGAFLIVSILLLQCLGTVVEVGADVYKLLQPLFVKTKFRNLQKTSTLGKGVFIPKKKL